MKPNSRLIRMLRRLRIDVVRQFDLNLALISRAAVVCETCPRPAECEAWLRDGKQDRGYRAFCPNASKLDCLPRGAVIDRDDRVA